MWERERADLGGISEELYASFQAGALRLHIDVLDQALANPILPLGAKAGYPEKLEALKHELVAFEAAHGELVKPLSIGIIPLSASVELTPVAIVQEDYQAGNA